MARWEMGDEFDRGVPLAPAGERAPEAPGRPKGRLRTRHAIEQAMIHHASVLKALDGYTALCWVLGWDDLPGIDG